MFVVPAFLSVHQAEGHTMPEPQSFDRLLWKTADRIHNRLKPEKLSLTDLLLPETPWLYWQVCLRRIRRAGDRQWSGAVKIVRREALEALAGLTERLSVCRSALALRVERAVVSSVGEIYCDLVSLRDEFPKVAVELSNRSVSVTTEPIVLEETYLGPFEIKLSWTGAGDLLSYEVLACEPHPATTSDETTHPHVESDRLCEGDGSPLIRLALQQGRLADFFLIVRQILETYNSGSAYVQLDQWSGRSCPDCGDHYDDDSGVCCGDCESDVCGACGRDCGSCGSSFCGECLSACSRCSDSTCNGCLRTCSGCDEPVCEGCLEICSDCHSTQCEGCLNEGLCSDCCSQEEENETSQTPTADTGIAIQPVCLGEVVVST